MLREDHLEEAPGEAEADGVLPQASVGSPHLIVDPPGRTRRESPGLRRVARCDGRAGQLRPRGPERG